MPIEESRENIIGMVALQVGASIDGASVRGYRRAWLDFPQLI
jgi:hypothetical protein